MSQGKGRDILEPALGRLVDYTHTHFANEEHFLRVHGYPDTDAHVALHDRLTAQVVEFQQRFLRAEACLTIDLMTFLQNWLENHIKIFDQKYAAHILGKAAA